MATGTGVFVGVSIASNAEAAIIDERGNILRRSPIKTLWGRSTAATLQPYIQAIEAMLMYAGKKHYRARGIGFSIPGMLDAEARRPLAIPLQPALNGFPLCELLEMRYALPACLMVDVDAALLGEFRFGAGKDLGKRRLFLLSVNAVVGASLLINGEIARHAPPLTGHVSHVPAAASGPRCSCGKRGCINTLITLDALQKRVQHAIRRGEETTLAHRLLACSPALPYIIAEEARRGDPVALRISSEINRWLSAATARYVEVFQPESVILGGEIAIAAHQQFISSSTSPIIATSGISVIPARLGRDAALLGIAAVSTMNERYITS